MAKFSPNLHNVDATSPEKEKRAFGIKKFLYYNGVNVDKYFVESVKQFCKRQNYDPGKKIIVNQKEKLKRFQRMVLFVSKNFELYKDWVTNDFAKKLESEVV